MRRTPRPCPIHGCPELQPCPTHPRIAWDGSDRSARLPANWHFIRRRVMRRDGHRCTWIEDGRRCPAPAVEVDHIINGDDHSMANLRSLCSAHHKKKSSAEGHAARRMLRLDADQPAPALQGGDWGLPDPEPRRRHPAGGG